MTDFLSNLEPWHYYFGIAVVLLGLEMLTGTFDLLWLGLGALAGPALYAAWGWNGVCTAGALVALLALVVWSRVRRPE